MLYIKLKHVVLLMLTKISFTLLYFIMDYNSAIFKNFQFDYRTFLFCTIEPFKDQIRA